MPTITLDTAYLKKQIRYSIDNKKLKDMIFKLGMEVESISEEEMQLEVTPNRPDLFGAAGMARAVRNFMHKNTKFEYAALEGAERLEIRVGRKVRRIRPYIAGLIARDLELDDAAVTDVMNFSEKFCATYGRERRKIALGMHNLDAIKPPLEYDAYKDEAFLPLGYSKEESFSEILTKSEKGKRYGIEDSGLYPVLRDTEGVIALIPVLNSERTRVGAETKNLFVDITGTADYLVGKSADMLAAMFIDMGAEIERVKVRYKSNESLLPLMRREYMRLKLSRIEREIGVQIGYNSVISLANKMGYEAALVGRSIRFTLPVYRLDIINEQDIIEDIAIAYGYDYIAPLSVFAAQQGILESGTLLLEKVSELMIGAGFSEMMNTYLTSERENFEEMRIKPHAAYIKLKSPKAQSITMARTWLLPSLLKNASLSVHEKSPQRFFENDMVFTLNKNANEEYHLAALSIDPKANFNQAKALAEALAYALGIRYSIEREEHKSFIPGRCARMLVGSKRIGFFGEVHPDVLYNFRVEEPGIALEINLSGIFSIRERMHGGAPK